ncbi:MAG: MBL fold metallo-hydrolase [Stappiaceae bacterium]
MLGVVGRTIGCFCFSFAVAVIWLSGSVATAQTQPSTCIAVAQSIPGATHVAFQINALASHEVRITFVGHSTYLIESADGVTIATDFSGFGGVVTPKVVTMNRAHSTHFTNFPDPEIAHVLRGWDPEGGAASHYLTVDDVLIRNVTTDIVRGGLREPDANSIFIFEVAGLCIGHLGHLHHALTEEHYSQIGRLDVVMVPIDGGLTLSLEGMSEIIRRLRSSVILPMHARGWATSANFVSMLGETVDHKVLTSNTLVLSLNSLPARPTVIVPAGL